MTQTPLPSSYEYGFVVTKIIRVTGDGLEDPDDLPDGFPAGGTVTFTPTERLRKAEGAFVIHESVTRSIGQDGLLRDLHGNPYTSLVTGVYTASFAIPGGTFPNIIFELLPSHTRDEPYNLYDAIPYVPAPGGMTQILEVPAGIPSGYILAKDGSSLVGVSPSAWPTLAYLQNNFQELFFEREEVLGNPDDYPFVFFEGEVGSEMPGNNFKLSASQYGTEWFATYPDWNETADMKSSGLRFRNTISDELPEGFYGPYESRVVNRFADKRVMMSASDHTYTLQGPGSMLQPDRIVHKETYSDTNVLNFPTSPGVSEETLATREWVQDSLPDIPEFGGAFELDWPDNYPFVFFEGEIDFEMPGNHFKMSASQYGTEWSSTFPFGLTNTAQMNPGGLTFHAENTDSESENDAFYGPYEARVVDADDNRRVMLSSSDYLYDLQGPGSMLQPNRIVYNETMVNRNVLNFPTSPGVSEETLATREWVTANFQAK